MSRPLTFMWKICRSEQQNLANWPVEFGKICRIKQWSLVISFVWLYVGSENHEFQQEEEGAV